jgi:glycosyltransferase involved in cell wall biosynthesis
MLQAGLACRARVSRAAVTPGCEDDGMNGHPHSNLPSPPSPAAKLVFVNRYFHPDCSATSQLLTDLGLSLARLGYPVHVVCSRQLYDDPATALLASELVDLVQVHRVWTTRFGRTRLIGRAIDYATFYASSAWVLIRLLSRGDTVIAETDPPLISIVAMAAARLKGAHLINWLQDIFPEVASQLGVNPLPRVLIALLGRGRDLALRNATVNVVLGQRMRERLQAFGIAEGKIRIIENWAERDPPQPKQSACSELRHRLGLAGHFVIGYSGNLGRAHEFQTLLGAAQELESETDVVFLMIGGGSGMDELRKTVTARGLGNFRFLTYQPRERLSDCLAAADVHWVSLKPALEGLIVPSKFYGILAAARPVVFIGDPDGELARHIRASQCGADIGVGASEDLVRLLRRWKSEPALRDRMGRNGYRFYQDHYAARRAVEQWRRMLTP